jgi:hypothetical protein
METGVIATIFGAIRTAIAALTFWKHRKKEEPPPAQTPPPAPIVGPQIQAKKVKTGKIETTVVHGNVTNNNFPDR